MRGRLIAYPVGVTLRGDWSRFHDNRLRHAWTPWKASRTGVNHRAVCGASVLPEPQRQQFDPNHERACRRCAVAIRRLESLT